MPARDRLEVARRARDRVLAGHTAAHRADELEALVSAHSPTRPLPFPRAQKQLASPNLS